MRLLTARFLSERLEMSSAWALFLEESDEGLCHLYLRCLMSMRTASSSYILDINGASVQQGIGPSCLAHSTLPVPASLVRQTVFVGFNRLVYNWVEHSVRC